MKSNLRTRLLVIAEQLARRRFELGPLFLFHNAPTLPTYSPEEVEAARKAGRPILNIRFVKPEHPDGIEQPPDKPPALESLAEQGF